MKLEGHEEFMFRNKEEFRDFVLMMDIMMRTPRERQVAFELSKAGKKEGEIFEHLWFERVVCSRPEETLEERVLTGTWIPHDL